MTRGPRSVLGFLVFALVISDSAPAAADPGDVDQTFGGDGRVITDFGGTRDEATDVAVQKDGRIVVVGFSLLGGGGGYRRGPVGEAAPAATTRIIRLARYRLDRTFGGDGRVTSRLQGSADGHAVAVQPDGKVVVAGSWQDDIVVLRFRRNGDADASFGNRGVTTIDASPRADVAYDVAVASGGRIVVAGCRDAGRTTSSFLVARLLESGVPDPGFGIEGRARTDVPGDHECARAVAIGSNNSIVAGGYSFLEGDYVFAAVRYYPGGSRDPSFGDDGVTTTDPGPGPNLAWGLALHRDGRPVLAGSVLSSAGEARVTLVRYRNNGAPDPSFDGDGVVVSPFCRTNGQDVGILGDGSILVAGHVITSEEYRFTVERYRPNGTIDGTFGHRGRSVIDVAPQRRFDAWASAVAVGDGRIVVAGETLNSARDFAVVALES